MTTFEQDAERYHLAMIDAAEGWRLTHKDAYCRMSDGVMGAYTAEPGEFARRMALLTRLVAQAAGFPCLSVWLNRNAAQEAAA